MGGKGSGRHWTPGAKQVTEAFRTIDVREWKRANLLNPEQSFSWGWQCHDKQIVIVTAKINKGGVVLTHAHFKNEELSNTLAYSVHLDWTTCHMGGKRPWFLCPVNGCLKRSAILYGDTVFACRRCYGLVYLSQRERGYDRLARRANRIRKKLGWTEGILSSVSREKPKHMHWKTYDRLTERHDDSAFYSLLGIARQIDCF